MTKNLTKMVVSIIVIIGITYITFFGLELPFFAKKIPGAFDSEYGVKLGLDLSGGSVIVYEAQADNVTTDQMATVVQVLQRRVTAEGFSEALVSRQGEKRVRVEIPSITDPEEAVRRIGKTAKLTFNDSAGNVVLEGNDVEQATAQYGQLSEVSKAEYYVNLTLTDAGAAKFEKATSEASQKADGENYISIKLDDEEVSSPRVEKAIIPGKTAVISGGFTQATANELANYIKSGQLPFALKDVELKSVGPILGEQALRTSLIAGLIGISLVILYMLICYRGLGLVADIALILYISLVVMVLNIIQKVNLTLPGIAGIVLGIGMAVDANVIIFERIKEEIRSGKSLKASIDAGFRRAFTAIFDSNVTTLITAAVLGFFATGFIQGFAITLAIGILCSMFTAITVTKFLLNTLIGMNVRNRGFYGVKNTQSKEGI